MFSDENRIKLETLNRRSTGKLSLETKENLSKLLKCKAGNRKGERVHIKVRAG